MLKVYRLIDSTDYKVLAKLIYLDRLVRLYGKFLTYYKTAGVYSDGQNVRVKFMTINKYGYENFTIREFPIDKIDERTDSYKNKVTREFNARHDNVRIQRLKDIHKWKKYIDNAKIHL
jgi:hypothetical protein